MKVFNLGNEPEAERFKFEFERHVIGRKIEGGVVTAEYIELHLDGGSAIGFRVAGPDIVVCLPDVLSPTLDTADKGRVM